MQLATQYAKLKGTELLAYGFNGTLATIVLVSGQKLQFTETELKKEIANLTPAPASKKVVTPAPEAEETKSKKKGE